MIRFFLFSFLFLMNCSSRKQNLHTLFSLPKVLEEVSAIEKIPGSDLLWMINDSGNSNHVFGVNTKGSIVRKIEITNVKNHDWEDLASDSDGNLFIADTGNNNQKRKKLAFYKIPNPSTFSDDVIEADIIAYYFPEQKKFPPKKKHYVYDVEATFYFKGFLYMITKNRSSKFDGTTSLYKIPAKKGRHAAILLGRFKTCKDSKTCQITAADISPDKQKIALLGHDKVWVFSNFEQDDFLNGTFATYPLHHDSQKESLCFLDNETLLIADEKQKKNGGNVYQFELKE